MKRFYCFLVAAILFCACSEDWKNGKRLGEKPVLFPDYAQTTIPYNIAPLNFTVRADGCRVSVLLEAGVVKFKVEAPDGKVRIPEKKWKRLLQEAKDDSVRVTVARKKGDRWEIWQPVSLNVAADPDRLFVVEGGGVVVKVHGTVFNMKAREKQDHVDVSLLSGLVVVENHGVSRSLNPGETAVCKKSVPSIEKKTTDVSISCLWAKESLRFEKKTIYELTGYLSEWYGMDIRLDPSLPTDQAYTFTITHESLEEVPCLIAKITPIEYVFDEDNTVRITRK